MKIWCWCRSRCPAMPSSKSASDASSSDSEAWRFDVGADPVVQPCPAPSLHPALLHRQTVWRRSPAWPWTTTKLPLKRNRLLQRPELMLVCLPFHAPGTIAKIWLTAKLAKCWSRAMFRKSSWWKISEKRWKSRVTCTTWSKWGLRMTLTSTIMQMPENVTSTWSFCFGHPWCTLECGRCWQRGLVTMAFLHSIARGGLPTWITWWWKVQKNQLTIWTVRCCSTPRAIPGRRLKLNLHRCPLKLQADGRMTKSKGASKRNQQANAASTWPSASSQILFWREKFPQWLNCGRLGAENWAQTSWIQSCDKTVSQVSLHSVLHQHGPGWTESQQGKTMWLFIFHSSHFLGGTSWPLPIFYCHTYAGGEGGKEAWQLPGVGPFRPHPRCRSGVAENLASLVPTWDFGRFHFDHYTSICLERVCAPTWCETMDGDPELEPCTYIAGPPRNGKDRNGSQCLVAALPRWCPLRVKARSDEENWSSSWPGHPSWWGMLSGIHCGRRQGMGRCGLCAGCPRPVFRRSHTAADTACVHHKPWPCSVLASGIFHAQPQGCHRQTHSLGGVFEEGVQVRGPAGPCKTERYKLQNGTLQTAIQRRPTA